VKNMKEFEKIMSTIAGLEGVDSVVSAGGKAICIHLNPRSDTVDRVEAVLNKASIPMKLQVPDHTIVEGRRYSWLEVDEENRDPDKEFAIAYIM
jgi:hypothetical protein